MRLFVYRVTVNLYKTKGLSLQKTKVDCSSTYPTHSNWYNKGSHYVSQNKSKFSKLTGSLTVEAAIVFPIFILAIVQLLSVFIIYYEYSKQLSVLHQSAKALGVAKYITEDAGWDIPLSLNPVLEDDIADLFIIRDLTPKVMITGQKIMVCVRSRVRAWTGYDNTKETELETYVYVTEYGEVYHISRNCSHLHLSIQEITRDELEDRRNTHGARYTECAYCMSEENAGVRNLYITEDGDKYHNTLECIGLTRTIRMIRLSETGQYRPCSTCCGNTSDQ